MVVVGGNLVEYVVDMVVDIVVVGNIVDMVVVVRIKVEYVDKKIVVVGLMVRFVLVVRSLEGIPGSGLQRER